MHTVTLPNCLLTAVCVLAFTACDSKDAAQKELMEKGVIHSVLDVGSEVGRNALCQAIVQEEKDIAEKLLEAGVSPDARYHADMPVLSIAVQKQNMDIFKMLLDHGADVNKQCTNGHTALMYAAFAGDLDMVKILLDHKADANIKNKEQWTALMAACAKSGRISESPWDCSCIFAGIASRQTTPKKQRAVVQALIDAGAKATCDKRGWTPAAIAACEGRPQMVKQLAGLAQDTDESGTAPIPPLIAAAWSGENKTVADLIKNGANVNESFQNETPLTCAARHGHTDTVSTLCKAGADPNSRNMRGVTPLARAVMSGNPECVKRMLECGANPQDEDAISRTVSRCDRDSLCEILDAGASLKEISDPYSLLKTALWNVREQKPYLQGAAKHTKTDALELIKVLIAAGIDLNRANKEDGAILCYFIKFHGEDAKLEDTLAVIDLFLESGANPNSKDDRGDPALEIAASTWLRSDERTAVMKALIHAGADVNLRDSNGDTPIHALIRHANTKSSDTANTLDCLDILLDAGADPNLKKDDTDPIVHKVIKGILLDADTRRALLEKLIRKGADVNAQDSLKRTALHLLVDESTLYMGKEQELPKLAKLLMSARPNLHIKDYRGKTPIEVLDIPYRSPSSADAELRRIIK